MQQRFISITGSVSCHKLVSDRYLWCC